MPRKDKYQRRLDADPPIKFGNVTTGGGDVPTDTAPPAIPTLDAPDNLALTTTIGTSTAAPTAIINATWDAPLGTVVDFYVIEWSETNTFPAATTTGQRADQESAAIYGLKPGVLYYVRVAAYRAGIRGAFSATASITTATDTNPAGVPTSISATWIGYGDLLVTWTNPTNANLKDVQVVVRASSGGTIYRTAYSAAQRFLYTLAMNLQDTAGAGDSSLYVELQSRTFSNVLGTTVNTGLVTKSAPATPTGFTQSWSGDTGTAGADLAIAWNSAVDAMYWTLTLDTVARRVGATKYTYTLDTNTAEHSGTPDPVVTYSLTAVDGFGQASTAVSGTATNAAPPTPTVTLTAGFSILIATVGGTIAKDFAAYEYVWKRDATTVRTLESAAAEQQYELSGASDDGYHSWTVVVRQKDVFAQYSTTITSGAQAFETLTLSGLRARIGYTDSIATSPSSLKTEMSNDIRDSGGVSYNA